MSEVPLGSIVSKFNDSDDNGDHKFVDNGIVLTV